MSFRFLATIAVLTLFFADQPTFGGPTFGGTIGIGFDVDIDDLENNPGFTEGLLEGLSDESGGFSPMNSVRMLQSVLGTPFSIAPPVVELMLAAMMIIIEEEEEELLAVEDVDEVYERLRPILYSELGFIRLICDDLTVEQRAQIRSAAEASLKHSASKMAAPQEGDLGENVGVMVDVRPDPISAIRREIDVAMNEILTAEKYAMYKALAESRAAHRKRAAVLAIVAQLDGSLCLSFQQREKILDEISTHWQNEWEQWLEWDSEFSELPNNLDPIVRPLLDASQAAVWKQTPKSQIEQVLILKQEAESEFNDGWWGEVKQMAPDDDGKVEEFPF